MRRGGGSKAVWNFSKNSSVLVAWGFPKAVHATLITELCRGQKLGHEQEHELGVVSNIARGTTDSEVGSVLGLT